MIRLPAAVWAAAALTAAACTGGDGFERPRVGNPVPEYGAVTLEGDSVSLADLRGEVVLLNLWATWCAPCRYETPYLQEIHERHRADGLHIVGVSMDTPSQLDLVAGFVEEYGVGYTILHDAGMVGMDRFTVLGLPATFLIDREGVLRWMRFGPIAEGDPEFLAALEETLE